MNPNQNLKPDHSMPQPDIRLLEMMASKICHDLISPVGAISNGVEILEELGPDAGEDVTGLISFSATQAAAKLKTLRMAYGLGGADSSIKPEDVHKTFGDFIGGDGRVKQDWDPHKPLGTTAPTAGFSKILICSMLLVIEGLPKGGLIRVTKADDTTTLISGEGENAGLKPDYLEALDQKTSTESLTPKQVHACLTGLLAAHYGFTLSYEHTGANTIILKLCAPVV
jgi:histidine phosphotransferase ChpT